MSIALTAENKKVLKLLRKTGRWANDSEIVRYGLHLVLKECKSELRQNLAPYSGAEISSAYQMNDADDWEMERSLGQASARIKPGEPG